MGEKVQMSQDTLFDFLVAHNVKLTRIGELMGMNDANLNAYFQHFNDNHGRPRKFSAAHIQKLNEALPVLSQEISACKLTFGSPEVRTNKWGKTYDPGLVEPLKRVGRYLNLTALAEKVLGWNKRKKSSNIAAKSSKSYGNITADDAAKVNAELVAVSAVLGTAEVILPLTDSSSSSSSL